MVGDTDVSLVGYIGQVMNGFIVSHRSFLNWEWYKTPNMFHFYHHLLYRANHKDGKWQGISIKRGQFISGRKQLSKETGISERSVRTCLARLKSTNELTIKSTSKYSVFTLNNYNLYQDKNDATNKSTSKRPASDQQATTNNNDNKENNLFSLEDFSMKASTYLFEEIRKRDSKAKKPDLQKWAGFIEKLKKIDNRDEKEIAQVLRFSQEDQFWQSNILSTRKFRDKYSTLLQKSKKGAKNESFAKRSGNTATEILKGIYANGLNEYREEGAFQIGNNENVPLIQQGSGGGDD